MREKYYNYAVLKCPNQPYDTDICPECGGVSTFRRNKILKTCFIGKKEASYYYDPMYMAHLASPELLNLLKHANITGFYDQKTEFIEWTDRSTGKQLDLDGNKYREIIITGRGGYLTDLHGTPIPHCNKCGKIIKYGIYSYKGFSTDDWDGSDMFFLKNWPGVLIVTSKVMNLVKKNGFKSIRFLPLNEYQFV